MNRFLVLLFLFLFSCNSPKNETQKISGISKLAIKSITKLKPNPIADVIKTKSIQQIFNHKKPEDCKTRKYAGEYSFGHDVEIESVGYLTVYPDSDSSILFYISLCRGEPSYSLGQGFDQAVVDKNKSSQFLSTAEGELGCILHFYFKSTSVRIETEANPNHEGYEYECNFGHGVYADHIYQKTSRKIPVSYMTQDGDTVEFCKSNLKN